MLVSGSRGYVDYAEFVQITWNWIQDIKDEKLVFITGKAATGADDLIIRFCKEFGFPWVEFKADWKSYGKAAGMLRNIEMGKVANKAMFFWDGTSKGTRNMLEWIGVRFDGTKGKLKMPYRLAIIQVPKENNHEWKPQES